MLDPDRLLAAYDDQLRGHAESYGAMASDRDGPVVRVHYAGRGFLSYRSLGGLTGSALDALIERQVAHFAERNQEFEWKTRAHDEPADLTDRLRAHGFVAEPTETVVVGLARDLATEPELPPGVVLRAVTDDADLGRVAAMESAVWGDDRAWLVDDLHLRARAGDTVVLVAEAAGEVVSAGWVVYQPGTDFAGLWGGSTLAAWRGRGIYRALVARRAQLAVAEGYRYLQVDASDESRPILQRLGFVPVTTTTPYIWTPHPGEDWHARHLCHGQRANLR